MEPSHPQTGSFKSDSSLPPHHMSNPLSINGACVCLTQVPDCLKTHISKSVENTVVKPGLLRHGLTWRVCAKQR